MLLTSAAEDRLLREDAGIEDGAACLGRCSAQ